MSAFGRKETKMKDIHKSALLALISIPITIFGVIAGYAIAHGMFAFMLILLAPGMLMMRVFGDSNLPDSMLMALGFIFQYLGYFVIIHAITKIIRKLKSE